jgi:hypothetical protein
MAPFAKKSLMSSDIAEDVEKLILKEIPGFDGPRTKKVHEVCWQILKARRWSILYGIKCLA